MSKKQKITAKKYLKQQIDSLAVKLRFWDYDCFEYSYYRPGCGGECDICRCSAITDIEQISNISVYTIWHLIFENILSTRKNKENYSELISPMFKYAVHRLIVANDLHSDVSLRVDNGYYGQEANGIKLNSLPAFTSDVLSVFDFGYDDTKVLRFLLEKEYGWFPEFLGKKVPTFQSVSIDDIDYHFNKVMIKLDDTGIPVDEKYPKDVPLLVLEKAGSLYKMVDGHHRYLHYVHNKMSKIPVWVYDECLN